MNLVMFCWLVSWIWGFCNSITENIHLFIQQILNESLLHVGHSLIELYISENRSVQLPPSHCSSSGAVFLWEEDNLLFDAAADSEWLVCQGVSELRSIECVLAWEEIRKVTLLPGFSITSKSRIIVSSCLELWTWGLTSDQVLFQPVLELSLGFRYCVSFDRKTSGLTL